MQGVVFFETSGGHDHAHLVVTATATASSLHFLLQARYLLADRLGSGKTEQGLRIIHLSPK